MPIVRRVNREPETAELANKALDVGEDVVDRFSEGAKRSPVAATALAVAEVVGTIVAFGLAETVVAGAASYVVYKALRERHAPWTDRGSARR